MPETCNSYKSMRDMDPTREQKIDEAAALLYNSSPMASGSYGSSFKGDRHRYSSLVDDTTTGKRISAVRRTFCLLILFDLILAFILWVIYMEICEISSGKEEFANILKALYYEVMQYSVQTSMFDLVMVAACRFTILELTYALYKAKKPWMVAFTTCATTIGLIAKVFLFEDYSNGLIPPASIRDKNNSKVIAYVILILQLVMVWAETWFLDFRVLRQEKKAEEKLISTLTDPERPDMPQFPRFEPDIWRTPISSPHDSDDEVDGFRNIRKHTGSRSPSGGSNTTHLAMSEEMYLRKAQENLTIVWQLFTNQEGWKRMPGNSAKGVICTKKVPKMGKIFKINGIIDVSPQTLLDDLFHHLPESPDWNDTILDAEILHSIDDNTDLAYTVAAEGAGGLVSARDFTVLRHWVKRDETIVVSQASCDFEDKPPVKQYVRGEQKPGGFMLEPVPGEPHRTNFSFILNTDLKGWIPQSLVDQALSGALNVFFEKLKKHCENTYEPEV